MTAAQESVRKLYQDTTDAENRAWATYCALRGQPEAADAHAAWQEAAHERICAAELHGSVFRGV